MILRQIHEAIAKESDSRDANPTGDAIGLTRRLPISNLTFQRDARISLAKIRRLGLL